MASKKRPHRLLAGDLGLALILGGAAATGGGCSDPSCEETLTCPPSAGGTAGASPGMSGAVGAGATGGGAAAAGHAGSGDVAMGGNAGGGARAGRGGSASDASGNETGGRGADGPTGGTAGSDEQDDAGAAGTDNHACDDVTCAHGGTCEAAGTTFKCECAAGYDGEYCEHNINECLSLPCLHGGSCTDGVNEYACDCDGTGYFGERCEVAHFELIGPPGAFGNAISANGKIVVGWLDGVPARWTAETGFQKLEALSEPVDGGEALAVSADGSVIGGSATLSSGDGPFRWTANTGVVSLLLPSDSMVVGVSADGNAMAVGRGVGAGTIAFRWTPAGGTQEIGDLGAYGVVSGISADGTVIVGSKYDTDDGGFVSFRWTSETGVIWLDFHGEASAVSGDGKTIVGRDREVAGVFVYTTTNGYVHVDADYTGGDPAVNYDGSVIVGQFSDVAGVWDRPHGVRLLSDLLAERGADPGNLVVYVSDVSADGTVLMGAATDKDSNQSRTWIARL